MSFHPDLMDEARLLTAKWYPNDAGSVDCCALIVTIRKWQRQGRATLVGI